MKHYHDPPSDTLAALANLHVLRGCPRADLIRLTRDADLIDIPAGDVIDIAGTRARQFVGIVDGYVHGVSTDGGSVVLGPGDQLGAAELIDGHPHVRSYAAATAATIVVVFGPAFRAVAGPIPGVPEAARRQPDPRPAATDPRAERPLVALTA